MRARTLVVTLGVLVVVAIAAASYGALTAKQNAADFVRAAAMQDISALGRLGFADSARRPQALSRHLFGTDAAFLPARVDASLDSRFPVQLFPVTYGVTVAVSGGGTPNALEGDRIGLGIVFGLNGRPSVGQMLPQLRE